MMQAADARDTHDLGGPGRPWFDHTARRRLLLQGIMNTIFVVILDVLSNEPTQVRFAQHDGSSSKLQRLPQMSNDFG